MLQKYAPPWCEIHFQVKIYKILYVCVTFGDSDAIERNLGVKCPTIWTDEKQSRAKAERRKRLEEKRSEKKSQKKEDADASKT